MVFFNNPKQKHVVGTYTPSSDWNQFEHFAVMDDKTSTLIASVGYFHHRHDTEITPKIEDYKHFFECIEQAQIYANATRMLEFIQSLGTPESEKLLIEILDITEPVERLLGSGALPVLEHLID